MGTAENKAIYSRFIDEAFNQGNFDNLNEILASGYRVHDLPPGTPSGIEGVKASVSMFRTAFPDLQITLAEVIGEGDFVAARANLRGTHRGDFMGRTATGRSVSVTNLAMVRIQDGRIAETWVKDDIAGLMRQISPEPVGAHTANG